MIQRQLALAYSSLDTIIKTSPHAAIALLIPDTLVMIYCFLFALPNFPIYYCCISDEGCDEHTMLTAGEGCGLQGCDLSSE